MTSIIKVNNIQNSSGTSAMTIDGSSNITFPQNVTFSGTVTGDNSGSLVKLLSATISSAVSVYDISSTYINSTYDSYRIIGYFLPADDNKYLMMRVFVGGTVQTSSIYGYETNNIGSGNAGGGNTESDFGTQQFGSGNQAGEGSSIDMTIQNVNSTVAPFAISGFNNHQNTDPNHNASTFGGSLLAANRANVVNGLRFKFHTGNIASGTIKLYGIVN